MEFVLKDYSLLDEIGPEKIIYLNNPVVNMKAVLVIDNSVYGTPSGGVRLAPDITVDEMVRLARAMTLKFCTYKVPAGGAKAGIWGNPIDIESKNILLTSFAYSTSSFIKNYLYYPGPDMGTDDNDLLKIFNIVKMPNLAPKKIDLFKNGIPVEELFTGYGVGYCLEAIYNNLDKITKRKLDKTQKPRIILEGFGKVGTSIAMCLEEIRYQLNGISTINGAIFDEDGLDIKELLKLRLTYGDELVNKYESKNLIKIPKEKLFELSTEFSTEFIIPGARPDSINRENVDKIDATAIVPAANIPYEKGILKAINEKNLIAFPDFVVNAGEVLAIYIGKAVKNVDEIFTYLKSKITEKTLDIIQGSSETITTVYNYAMENAIKELKKKIKRKKNTLEKMNKRY
ncbi:MAG: Glu/Leu/Phe/Val dehydrogenase dimerization domain-containing protein [Promethearchaeota archaeon]|jgi:glutamate dehydrogenase/leucine dehydrogenase